jgi:hypothetical protein
MATTHKLRPIQVSMTSGKDYPTKREGKEAAAQSFIVGDLLVRTGAQITLCGVDPAAIVGVAEKAASGVTNALCPYSVNQFDLVWEGNLMGAAGADYIIADTDIQAVYGLARDATTKQWFLDQSDTANARARIIGLAPGMAIGDTNARVLFEFLASTMTTANGAYA